MDKGYGLKTAFPSHIFWYVIWVVRCWEKSSFALISSDTEFYLRGNVALRLKQNLTIGLQPSDQWSILFSKEWIHTYTESVQSEHEQVGALVMYFSFLWALVSPSLILGLQPLFHPVVRIETDLYLKSAECGL